MALTLQLTNYGLNALASAISGGYVAPQWLIIDTTHATLTNPGTLAAGATSVSVSASISQAGDTQIVVGVGTANQEVLTFTGTPTLTGGNYVYTLSSPTTFSHTNGDICIRQPTVSDTTANIISEMQVDPTYLPSMRQQTSGGYPNGNGIWDMQMYLTGIQANGYIAIVGLVDSVTMGQGNLHALGVLGVDHTIPNGQTSTNDLEIDAVITLVNG